MIVFAAAGGKSGSSGSPVAPSNAQPQPAPGATTGATIAGVVTSGTLGVASTAAGRPLIHPAAVSGGIVVSIMGSSMSTMVDASGQFRLQNVPSGDVTLVFTAAGISATVAVTGVHVADQIHVTVIVNGDRAELDEHEHEGADHRTEVEGRVTATACTANPPTITVGLNMPTTVNLQNAQIRHGGTSLRCAQIQVNDRAEAHGMMNGTILIATDVNVETEHPQPPGGNDKDTGEDQEGDVTGTVAGAAAGHACPAFSFSVGSTTVTTSAATKFEDVTCAAVVNGISVEVEGTRTAANAIAAKKVEKK
jgi:Domain of unknown function (DUF5666)